MFGLALLARLGGGRRPGQGAGGPGAVMKPVSVLVLVQVLGSVSAQPEQPCPAHCECSEDTKTVRCVNRGLSELPRGLPLTVRTLLVTGNRLERLLPRGGGPSPLAGLSQLATLDLSGNHLRELEPRVFAGLPSLRELRLGDNSLQELSSLAFGAGPSPLSSLDLSRALYNESCVPQVAALLRGGALGSLSRLALDHNQLLYLPRGMFAALPSLAHLSLRNNSLVGLPGGFFKNLTQLRTLDLRDNSLRRLRNATLCDLPARGGLRLYLANNSWACDCEAEELLTWLRDTSLVPDKQQLLCADPEELHRAPLLSIDTSDLKCSDPDSLSSLQTSYVFLGIVLALIGLIFLLVLYLNRKGIKKWIYNIRDACRDHMEGYHYRYEINADPRLTNLSSNLDV